MKFKKALSSTFLLVLGIGSLVGYRIIKNKAQVNYINAITRYTTAQYEAKLEEVFLKELTGSLGVE